MYKTLILVTLLVLSFSYKEEDNVLVLEDSDFPGIFEEFSHILIEFYAPWCGHCKKLAPVYVEVAEELKNQGSEVRLAKVDATEQKKSAGDYQVKGFPTILFFLNGQKIDYTGGRNKESMVNWLLKKTRDPVVQLNQQDYEKLASADGVSVVYHGDFSAAEGASIFNQIAIADDYNTYYWGKDLGKQAGSIQIIRYFDSPATYGAIDDGLKNWVEKHQRPLVVPFDERTIGDMFGSSKTGIALFNHEDSAAFLEAFTEAAKEYAGEPLVFTQISSASEHLANFATYIKIDYKKSPLVMLNAGDKKKYVFEGDVSKENVLEFLENFKSFEYGLTDEVKYEEKAVPTQEQL